MGSKDGKLRTGAVIALCVLRRPRNRIMRAEVAQDSDSLKALVIIDDDEDDLGAKGYPSAFHT